MIVICDVSYSREFVFTFIIHNLIDLRRRVRNIATQQDDSGKGLRRQPPSGGRVLIVCATRRRFYRFT